MQRTVKKKLVIEPDVCAGCRHFAAGAANGHGYCRRYPPTPVSQETTYASVWPIVSDGETCGEFSRKLNS